MKSNFILFIILSLILLNKCQDDDDEFPKENLYDTFDDSFDDNGFFKSSLKEYLIEKDLYDSNRPIKPNELRNIFLEVISEGDMEKAPSNLKKIFSQLAEYFIVKYYKENKQIIGKDIINLFDIKILFFSKRMEINKNIFEIINIYLSKGDGKLMEFHPNLKKLLEILHYMIFIVKRKMIRTVEILLVNQKLTYERNIVFILIKKK